VVVFVVREEDVLVVAGGAAKIAASAKRRLLVRLHVFHQLHVLLPIAIHTSHHFVVWADGERLTEYRPPAPSKHAEKTDGLHRC
jgi:hypothetical protein